MEKKKITCEQFISGCILKFRVVDYDTILIIIEILKEKNIEIDRDNYNLNLDYIKMNDDTVEMRDDVKNAREMLTILEGDIMKNALEDVDIENLDESNPRIVMHILRKIRLYNNLKVENLDRIFNILELKIIKNLITKKFLCVTWNKDIKHQMHKELCLTKKGYFKVLLSDKKIKEGKKN